MGPLIRFGDTLAIHDGRNSRITLFLGDTLLLTLMVRAGNSAERFTIGDRLADGRWLAGTGVSPRFSPKPYQDSIGLGIFPASGDGDIQMLGWFPGPWIVSIEGQVTGLAAFYRWVGAKALGREIVVFDADQDRLRRFTLDGAELPAGPIPVVAEPMTPEVIEQAKRRETATGLDPVFAGKWQDTRYDPAVLGDRLPFRGFLVDPDSMVWLEAYREDHAAGKFFVLSVDGRLIATVAVPAGFRVTDIGLEYCLGVHSDADGVESVVMYRLRRD
jgi:hypothetical protein